MIAPTGLVPTPPIADIARVRNAARLAKVVLSGPIGDYLCRELDAWCEHGHRYEAKGTALAIAEDLEQRALAGVERRTS